MLQCAGVVRRPGTSMINERIKPSQKIYVIGCATCSNHCNTFKSSFKYDFDIL